MGRTAGNFCLRSSMPPLPELDLDETLLNHPIDTSMSKPAAEVMTWQQKKEFGHVAKPNERKPGRVQWKPFDPEAIEAPPTIAAEQNNSRLAQQSELQPPHKSRRKLRVKAATLDSPPHINSSTPTHIPPSESINNSSAHKTYTPPYKSRHRNKPKKAKVKMAPLPKSAYIPPHLRKKSTTNGQKAAPVPDPVDANPSPAVSEKSRTAVNAQLHSSPTGPTRVPSSPPSPPTTLQEPDKVEKSGYAGWDEPQPRLSVPNKSVGNPRWPRGLQPYKKRIWPKSRDMRPLPSSSGSDGGVTFKSNSNGDPYYDIKKLQDWDGNWLPAPESWSARKGHTDRHFGDSIEQWMNAQSADCETPMEINLNAFLGANGENTPNGFGCKELVPQYWMQVHVDNKTLREFWKTFPDSAPSPVDDDDVTGHAPWWELYEDRKYEVEVEVEIKVGFEVKVETKKVILSSPYLNSLVVPEAVVDPADVENNIRPCVLASASDKVGGIIARRQKEERRTLARRNRPVRESKVAVPQVEDRRLQPTINIYLRPVQPADVRGIAEIYNDYVKRTIYTSEFYERTEIQMRNRINAITEAGLPYLVAVSRGNQRNNARGFVHEKIVGFVSLSEYCDQASTFRYTFDMELFVHPGFTGKGIGKCLLDRILEMVDTRYNARGGYEYKNDFEYLKNGPSRVIGTIVLNVFHEHGENVESSINYLKPFKFVRKGTLSHMGYKYGKVVDVTTYQHLTGEDIDPKTRPTV